MLMNQCDEEMPLSGLKQMNPILSVYCRDQCLLLPAPGYVAEIQFGQVYLQEALDYLHSLNQ